MKYAWYWWADAPIKQQKQVSVKVDKFISKTHLDYHKTVENYLKAKKKFFDDLPKNAFSLTNLDDKNGLVMTQLPLSRMEMTISSLSELVGRFVFFNFPVTAFSKEEPFITT